MQVKFHRKKSIWMTNGTYNGLFLFHLLFFFLFSNKLSCRRNCALSIVLCLYFVFHSVIFNFFFFPKRSQAKIRVTIDDSFFTWNQRNNICKWQHPRGILSNWQLCRIWHVFLEMHGHENSRFCIQTSQYIDDCKRRFYVERKKKSIHVLSLISFFNPKLTKLTK